MCTQRCSPLFFESHLLGTTNNHTFCLSSSERQPMEDTSFHTFPFPVRLITVVFEDFENFECPWELETSMVLFPGMLNVFQALFVVKQLFKNTSKRIPWVWIVTSSRVCRIECGKYLGQWEPPVSWNFLPEQVQHKYLGKVCCYPVNYRQAQITEMCWGPAHAYWSLFNTIQYLKGMRWSLDLMAKP